ncbi:aminotransferase class V-fold PLP-dependent enzyme [Cereibacter azotoformans]|uniref:aminotransferase class V-fold PLP-dependent enzyme n=1 Tax=Cereibacter azotoformans TaxID=43057 RepID=UPI002467EB28|nr:aminotransferase class V-fold PLP-dependent enzyme [Cereibacter azotoformans]
MPQAARPPIPAERPPREDRVSARSHGLPGEDDLRALLAGSPGPPALPTAPAPTEPEFYFVPARPAVPQVPASDHPAFDVHAVRRDFPILQERVNGRPLVWFDNAATTQKPLAVLDRLDHFYRHENSNIHRAAHDLAARATDAYEKARETVRAFLGASSADEIIFVRGATEGINLIARTWGAKNIGDGGEILVSQLEHHANIVPWQQLAQEKGARLKVIPVDDSGQVILEEARRLISPRTKIVAVTQVSNVLGTVVPVAEIVELAHRAGAVALVDGAQSVSHMRVDLQAMGADFFVFSGHKVFGPTGIGAVYGKGAARRHASLAGRRQHDRRRHLRADSVPAATAPIRGRHRQHCGRSGPWCRAGLCRPDRDRDHRASRTRPAGLRHPPACADQGRAADRNRARQGVGAVLCAGRNEAGRRRPRAERRRQCRQVGHHCAQPILRRFGLEATVRPSLTFYNTCEEVDRFISVVRRLARA